MKTVDISKIDLSKLPVDKYENKWIAVSEDNQIVGRGDTYREAVEQTGNREDVILFKVPPLDVALAP